MTTGLQTAGFRRVLDNIRRTLPPPDRADWTDSLLLQRFLAHRDEAAFAALVQRHGSLVMSVCNRVLRNAHDSEDVFQAVFFILARKARSVIKLETLASWIYMVAFRAALAASAAKGRRHKREVQMRELPHREVQAEASQDWLPLLDRELSLLPK